ncbi:MAG: nucleoside-triphosphatase [Fidelibacterota bacterium]
MITIITGKVNAGKTTYMQHLYANKKKGDGFVSVKVFENNQHTGYDLHHLKTKNTKPFIRKKTKLPQNWQEIFKIGDYSFSKDGFAFAKDIIRNTAEEPVFIDEIGPLEIFQKSGFYSLLKERLNSDLYITLREHLYDDFLKSFAITRKINKITIKQTRNE